MRVQAIPGEMSLFDLVDRVADGAAPDALTDVTFRIESGRGRYGSGRRRIDRRGAHLRTVA
jgi:hypothetical protein